MPQSLANVLVHVIFSTKHRTPFLSTSELQQEMTAYLIGTLKNLECPSLATNAVTDHVHCLCQLSRKISIAELIEDLKKSSSKWIKQKGPELQAFYWQAGYGAFSVSPSNAPRVKSYIANQQEHHRKISYQNEFREFLRRHGVPFDEKFVWD